MSSPEMFPVVIGDRVECDLGIGKIKMCNLETGDVLIKIQDSGTEIVRHVDDIEKLA